MKIVKNNTGVISLIILLMLSIFIFVVSCSIVAKHQKIKDNGVSIKIKRGVPTGSITNIREIGSLKSDRKDGIWELFSNKDNKIIMKGEFKNGLRIGKWIYFNKKGNVTEETIVSSSHYAKKVYYSNTPICSHNLNYYMLYGGKNKDNWETSIFFAVEYDILIILYFKNKDRAIDSSTVVPPFYNKHFLLSEIFPMCKKNKPGTVIKRYDYEDSFRAGGRYKEIIEEP
jgi:competence protein ComGC